MKVRFTRQANAQLAALLAYVSERNPRAAGQIAARVDRMCDRIAENPALGRPQDIEGVRRRVIRPGGYLIYYSVDALERSIVVLAISHPAQRRPYRDA